MIVKKTPIGVEEPAVPTTSMMSPSPPPPDAVDLVAADDEQKSIWFPTQIF
jgi:hypothetical protein